MPVAFLPNLKQISLLQLDGKLTKDEFKECLNLAIKGCMQVYKLQREALMRKYFSTEVEV
jgi:exosome complex component RRP41